VPLCAGCSAELGTSPAGFERYHVTYGDCFEDGVNTGMDSRRRGDADCGARGEQDSLRSFADPAAYQFVAFTYWGRRSWVEKTDWYLRGEARAAVDPVQWVPKDSIARMHDGAELWGKPGRMRAAGKGTRLSDSEPPPGVDQDKPIVWEPESVADEAERALEAEIRAQMEWIRLTRATPRAVVCQTCTGTGRVSFRDGHRSCGQCRGVGNTGLELRLNRRQKQDLVRGWLAVWPGSDRKLARMVNVSPTTVAKNRSPKMDTLSNRLNPRRDAPSRAIAGNGASYTDLRAAEMIRHHGGHRHYGPSWADSQQFWLESVRDAVQDARPASPVFSTTTLFKRSPLGGTMRSSRGYKTEGFASIGAFVPVSLKRQVVEQAFKEDMTVSELIRTCLTERVSQLDNSREPVTTP
jgi:hypothetical protein